MVLRRRPGVRGHRLVRRTRSSPSTAAGCRPQSRASSRPRPAGRAPRLVQDEQGSRSPALSCRRVGSTSVFAVSGEDGRFTFRNLPAGPYLVRAHLQNYLPARGRLVQVDPRRTKRDDDRADPRSDATIRSRPSLPRPWLARRQRAAQADRDAGTDTTKSRGGCGTSSAAC